MKKAVPCRTIEGIPVVYEDRFMMVVDKPAGLPSQSDVDGTIGVIEMVKKTSKNAALIHRLDRPVGGLLVIAKTRQAAAILSESLKATQFGKDYLAVLWGVPSKNTDTLNDPLLRDGRSNTSSVVSSDKAHMDNVKMATLGYELLATTELPSEAVYGSKWIQPSPFADLFADSDTTPGNPANVKEKETPVVNSEASSNADSNALKLSLVRIHLETGRHHQIRVQMAHMGCPVFGDRKYGAAHLSEIEPAYRPDMPALYAYKLTLKHPKTGELMTFTSAPGLGYPFELFDMSEI